MYRHLADPAHLPYQPDREAPINFKRLNSRGSMLAPTLLIRYALVTAGKIIREAV
jgi:hypothetical protein